MQSDVPKNLCLNQLFCDFFLWISALKYGYSLFAGWKLYTLELWEQNQFHGDLDTQEIVKTVQVHEHHHACKLELRQS